MYAALWFDFDANTRPASPRNPVVFSFLGRLWGYMANARFQNFHGEDHCRLDRTTRVFAHKKQQPGIVSRCISATMFRMPQDIRGQLDELLVDGLVMERVWSGFIASQTAEWQKMMQWTFALIMYACYLPSLFQLLT